MCGKWKVTRNEVGGIDVFAVYRLRDTKAVDHSGNRELATRYLEDRQEAVTIAERLNAEAEARI